ncbi:MAG TPA: FecR domain-containing protein [Candidatus Didemnitutus sp.]|nr:FecR domain-containing protein [Candidatus Didemnitutus sp.]
MPTRTPAVLRWLLLPLAVATLVRAQEARVVEKEGRVVVTKSAQPPAPAVIGGTLAARDRLGTGEASRAVLQMTARWFARIDEETDVEVTAGALAAKDRGSLKIALGGAFVYTREENAELNVETPSATGGLRGTQLVVRVDKNGKTFMQVLEGVVDLANPQGSVHLVAGEAGEAEVGQAPRKTAVIETRNLLQWALYYPAVLEPNECGLSADESKALAASIESFRQGDLLGAVDRYPASGAPDSNAVRLYHASVLLATGRVEAAKSLLNDLPADQAGRRALDRLIAAVTLADIPSTGPSATSAEALAESYYQQSRRNLSTALAAARQASTLAPNSGFVWTRVAELEFSFGHTSAAGKALERGLALTPRNAAAHALRGYLLSADNRIGAARHEFEQAVNLDGGLGTAWLGLGLTKIKQGHREEGRADLQTAAVVEPNRSFFYSYHGKALSLEGADALARKDLDLARQVDPRDPTPWLYSAIEAQQTNRYSDAIDDMQQSIALNDNRRLYRSDFLLDQDKAVRNANLAKIYQNDGMTDVAVREATRAVDNDYTNPSAHLFLADSFYAVLDPKRVSLKYQTAWFNELLLANLLSPVGGGPLSQFVSQQEYSKLLEADGIGGSTDTEWRSGGYVDSQNSLFGTYGRLSVGVDFVYHQDNGDRPNSDDLRKEWWWQLKYQVTANDVVYGLLHTRDQTGGDLFSNYANVSINAGRRFEDKQTPGLALIGWNHHWAPGIDTLFLGGRLALDEMSTTPDTKLITVERDPTFFPSLPAGAASFDHVPQTVVVLSPQARSLIAPYLGLAPVTNTVTPDSLDVSERYQARIYTAELQQLWQTSRNTLLFGARAQSGNVQSSDLINLDPVSSARSSHYTYPPASQEFRVNLERETGYLYDYFKVVPSLTLIGGISWDQLKYPDNFQFAPLNGRQDETHRHNSKAGFTFAPSSWVTVRGAYTEALGGVLTDEDVRLEPVQFAGFNQAFRTVISESLASSVVAPVYRNEGLSVEGSLPSRTWWGASFNDLREHLDRTIGAFDDLRLPGLPPAGVNLPAGTAEKLVYREDVFAAGINQLVGPEFAVGMNYHRTRADLRDMLTQISPALDSLADTRGVASLDQLALTMNWNSPTGWFASTEVDRYHQEIEGVILGTSASATPGDDFWQGNLEVGYRFHHNLREISVGVLNLTDRDYHLSPLDNILEPPRNRTFFVRCRAAF